MSQVLVSHPWFGKESTPPISILWDAESHWMICSFDTIAQSSQYSGVEVNKTTSL